MCAPFLVLYYAPPHSMLIGFSIRTLIGSAREIGTDSRVRGVQSRSEKNWKLFPNFQSLSLSNQRSSRSIFGFARQGRICSLSTSVELTSWSSTSRQFLLKHHCWSAPSGLLARRRRLAGEEGRIEKEGKMSSFLALKPISLSVMRP